VEAYQRGYGTCCRTLNFYNFCFVATHHHPTFHAISQSIITALLLYHHINMDRDGERLEEGYKVVVVGGVHPGKSGIVKRIKNVMCIIDAGQRRELTVKMTNVKIVERPIQLGQQDDKAGTDLRNELSLLRGSVDSLNASVQSLTAEISRLNMRSR
jgi:hypothetical protein